MLVYLQPERSARPIRVGATHPARDTLDPEFGGRVVLGSRAWEDALATPVAAGGGGEAELLLDVVHADLSEHLSALAAGSQAPPPRAPFGPFPAAAATATTFITATAETVTEGHQIFPLSLITERELRPSPVPPPPPPQPTPPPRRRGYLAAVCAQSCEHTGPLSRSCAAQP